MIKYLKTMLFTAALVAVPFMANAQHLGVEQRTNATRLTLEPGGRANASVTCVAGELAVGGTFNLQPFLNSGSSRNNLGDASVDVVRTFVSTSGRTFQVTARLTPNADGPISSLVYVTAFCVPQFFTFDVEPADTDDLEVLEERIELLESFFEITDGPVLPVDNNP